MQENNTRTRHFYATQTYLDFPILESTGNPRIYTFSKKSEMLEFLDEPIANGYKRTPLSGAQVLSFGKRTNWRPKLLINEVIYSFILIKKNLEIFRKEQRFVIGVKPFLTWEYKNIQYKYPLNYPISARNILQVASNFSEFLIDKRPSFLPKLFFECEMIATFNLRDYSDGMNCKSYFFSKEFCHKSFYIVKNN